MAAGAAARLRRHRERRRHPGARAAPARRRGGAGHRRRQHAAGRRAGLGLPRRAVRAAAAAVQPGLRRRAGAPARACVRRLRRAATSTWCTTTSRRPGWPRSPRSAPTRRPCCTPCTGTSPSTPSCTARSTAATGSGSTASPPPSSPGRPQALRDHAVGHVHLATPLADGADRDAPVDKGDYVVVLGRITPGKGQDLGARLAHEAGFDLVLAGPVGPYQQPATWPPLARPGDRAEPRRAVLARAGRPARGRRPGALGRHGGRPRRATTCVAGARAALFPLRWEEPGGTVVVESLALGTPVVGHRPRLPARADRARPHRPAHRPTRTTWPTWCTPPTRSTRPSAAGRRLAASRRP